MATTTVGKMKLTSQDKGTVAASGGLIEPESPIAAKLNAVASAAGGIGGLAKPARSAVAALRACLKLQETCAEELYEAVRFDSATHPETLAARTAEEVSIPFGTEAPAAKNMLDEAMLRKIREIIAHHRDRVARQHVGEGDRLATEAVAAVKAFRVEIENAKIDHSAPDGLTGNQSLEDLLKAERLRAQLETLPLKEIERLYQNAVERGDVERQLALEYAAGAMLSRIASGAERKSPRHPQTPSWADGDQAVAHRLLSTFGIVREQRMPAEVRLAEQVYQAVVVCFREIVGLDVSRVSSERFARLCLDAVAAPDPLAPDALWWARLPIAWQQSKRTTEGDALVSILREWR